MKTVKWIRWVMLVVLLATASAGYAAKRVDKAIHLHHISAENLLPLIKPALPADAEISGSLNEVVIVTPATSLPQIEALVADLDTPLHAMAITVSLDANVLKHNSTGQDYFLPRDHIAVAGNQEVRVQEGSWAVLHTGRSAPEVSRTVNPDGTVTETIRYNKVNSGLRIKPELRGTIVNLTVQPFQEMKRQDGSTFLANGHPVPVNVGLGEWIALGTGSGNPTRAGQSGGNSAAPREYEVFIRFNVIP
ncbi:MAG: hypothetical protein LJE74_10400 [Proteobacteria bacterium]|jgi:type II secretory pathway component GspD/PulD (secretin)|nr:hypothetical protein [Pseudomonadota bacterium]MCG6936492.1 hypothetical protein [Pseudomonadota bacterium]